MSNKPLFGGITPGDKFGKLTVMSVHSVTPHGLIDWTCWCDCGGSRTAKHYDLRSGNISACGCTKAQHLRKSKLEISSNYWYRLQNGAAKRGIEFCLDIEYAMYLFRLQGGKCALSGWDIYLNPIKNQTASVDRIDSDKGYLYGNIQWLHRDLNFLKGKFSDGYVIQMSKAIARNHENS